MGKSFLDPAKYEHGTRARYVAAKCRCDLCRHANRDYYHERRRRALAAAAEVQPSRRKRPQWTYFMRSTKGGKRSYSVHGAMCPGVDGKVCVQGGAWLKNGTPVCSLCVERATVWNGLVSARRAKKHLLELRAVGVGYKAVAAACDVAHTVLCEILSGAKKRIRAQTEKRILQVDEDARADGALVPAAPTYKLLDDLFARGFTGRWISAQLGYVGSYASVLQCQKRDFFTARNAADIEKLHRRVLEQKLEPHRHMIDARPTFELVDELLEEGFTLKRLTREIGVVFLPAKRRRPLVRRSTAEKVERFHRSYFDADARAERYEPLSIDDFATARSG